jgi:excisionase family DNA binding protein
MWVYRFVDLHTYRHWRHTVAQQLVEIDGTPIEHEFEVLIKPVDAARLLCINPVTLAKWATSGKIRSVRTAGGHRRYPASAVRAACKGDWTNAAVKRSHGDMSAADVVTVTED